VTETSLPIQLTGGGIGSTRSTVQIKAQVDGQLIGIHFREGQEVRKGDLLFTLDRRPYEALLHKELANLSKDQVEAKNAKVEYDRTVDLLKRVFAAPEDSDRARHGSRIAGCPGRGRSCRG